MGTPRAILARIAHPAAIRSALNRRALTVAHVAVIAGIGDTIGDVWDAITGPASSIVEGISFASDPLGWIFGKTQDALDGLVSRLLPWLMSATKPDLTADWFLRTYAVSFGLAIMVWLLIVLGRLVAVARGSASGGDLIELLTTRSLTFIGGAMWGPAIGWVIVGIFHALSEGLLGLFGKTTEGALASLLGMIRGDWIGVPGGLLFATGLLVCMLIALTLVVIMLIVAMVALYLSGVIFPLGWVWVTDAPERRVIASKLAWTWLGLNAAHPLMFLMLSASFAFIASMVPMSSDPGIELLTNGIAAFVVMVITAVSPVLLFKFAPVLPTAAGQSMPSFSGGSGGGGGGSNDLRQVADEQAADDEADGGEATEAAEGGAASGAGGGAGGGGGGAEGAAPGPLETEAMNASPTEAVAPGTEGGDLTGGADDAAEGAESTAASAGSSAAEEAGGQEAGGQEAAGTAGGTGGGSSSPMGSSSTAEAAEGASSGAEAGEAAEAAAGAGAAESSTGVGAVIGIPTLIAAAGMELASKAVEAGGQGADMAAYDMDESQGETR